MCYSIELFADIYIPGIYLRYNNLHRLNEWAVNYETSGLSTAP